MPAESSRRDDDLTAGQFGPLVEFAEPDGKQRLDRLDGRSDVPSAGPSETLTLGPKGVGTLTLGATRDAAHATRLVHGLSGSKGLCGADGDGWIGSTAPAEDNTTGRLFFSATTGKLVAIYAYKGLTTPEGIKLGSTLAQVKTAYSHWDYYKEEGRGYATVPGNAKANYRIAIVDDKVFELSLDSVDQDCYE